MYRKKLASVLIAAVTGALIFPAIAGADLVDDLVAHWPLDGSFVDAFGNNDGEFMGTDDPFFDDGKFGQGIVLDGFDQFIEISNEENFDFVGQDFSISAWFRVDAFDKNWQALIAKGEGNRWRVHRRGGESIMTWNGGNADVPAGDNFPVDDDEIHHFVGVSTADEVLMYMDGDLVAIGPAPAVENNNMPVMIGENPDARNRNWNGLVDDVAIWGRALSEDEVGSIWNGGDGMAIPIPDVIPPLFVEGRDTIGQRTFKGIRSNEMFGPEESGVPGWTGRIVTLDDHGLTLDNHTIAEEALDDNDGTTALGAYPVVDMAGGAGTFPENLPYPDGEPGGEDFAVRVTADVVIPEGTWTIGFGSDDGGQLTIAGVQFGDSLNNDSFDDDQIRFEGNRGHGWTVGTFTLDEPLETSIVASMHERGGGDSFEIAITEGESIDVANAIDWELLGNGTLGWEVSTTSAPLVSAELSATVTASREMEFDVNGDTGESDRLVVENPDPNVFTTTLDVSDNLTFQIKSTGSVSSGEAFTIIGADRIVGTPTIISADPSQTWVFDAATGRVCLDSCPGALVGDFNGNGSLDANDLDLMATGMMANDPAFDIDGDGDADLDDRLSWIRDLKGTWVGDVNLDGEFNSSDFVAVFQAGKFETGAEATWGEGDWNGDKVFSSSDFVAAFQDGGFELGPRAAANAVPEPGAGLLAILAFPVIVFCRRRR